MSGSPGRSGRTPSRCPAAVAGSIGLALVIVAAAALVVSCGNSSPGLVVPVLWASGSEASASGGVEPARVSVVEGDGGFEVDLATGAAQGAGPQWLAASGSAAAVGSLVSGADPRALDVRFSISGPIDGPSGGAALTVGVLAAIRGVELREGVTMTGTISPDGSVGRVGLVPVKVRAAADAGYDLVLVPLANAADLDADTGLDVVALGASLGVEVRPVADVGEAVAAFTGGPVTAGATTPPPLSPAVAAVAERTTTAMVARLEAVLGGDEVAGVNAAIRVRAAERLATARAALSGGDIAGAGGAATEGLVGLVRAVADDLTTAAATVDLEGERARVIAEAGDVAGAAEAAFGVWSAATEGMTPPSTVGLLSLPGAMGWLSYARAAAEASGTAAAGAVGPAELGGIAGAVAEQRVAVEVLWPDALAVVDALADGPGALTDDPDGFLDGYTGLLTTASEANERYLEAVLASGGVPPSPGDPADVAARVLAALATGDGPAVVRTSAAMSWWFVTSSEVTGRQAFGLDGFGLVNDVGVPAGPATLEAAVRNAADTVTAAADTLAARGVDPSSPVWSTAWGVGAAAADASTPEATGEVLALGEVWYSAVTVFLLLAASAPVG